MVPQYHCSMSKEFLSAISIFMCHFMLINFFSLIDYRETNHSSIMISSYHHLALLHSSIVQNEINLQVNRVRLNKEFYKHYNQTYQHWLFSYF